MMRWWAAFFICGLVYPGSSLESAIVEGCAALALAAAAILQGQWAQKWRGTGGPRFMERDLARFVVLVAAGVVLWGAAGMAREARSGGRAEGGIATLAMRDERARFLSSLNDGRLSRRSAGFVAALVLGDRSGLSPALRERYSYLGISHFLAMSGLHLGVVALPLGRLLAMLIHGRGRRDAMLLVLLGLYSSIACFPPSLVRALAMSAAVIACRQAGLSVDLAGSLIAGAFLIVLVDPTTALDTGFELSFAAVMAIALIAIPVMNSIDARFPRGFAGQAARIIGYGAVVTCAVQYVTLPLAVTFFGRVPLIAPLANLLMTLPVGGLVYAGAAYVFVPVAFVRHTIAPFIEMICSILDRVPMALAEARQPGVIAGDCLLFIYGCGVAATAVALGKSRRRRGPALAVAAGCVTLSFCLPHMSGVEAWGLRQGDGQTVFITGKGYLYCGAGEGVAFLGRGFGVTEAGRLARDLWRNGRRRVGWCVIVPQTLPKRSGVLDLARRIEIEEVVCGAYLAAGERERLHTLENLGVSVRVATGELTVASAGLAVAVAAPSLPPAGGSIGGRATTLRCVIVEPRSSAGGSPQSVDPDRPYATAQ